MTKKKKKKTTAPKKANRGRATSSKTSCKKRSGGNQTAAKKRTSTAATSSKKNQPRNEFRDYKPSGHPAYIYEKVGNEFRFLGVTHAPITRGIKNIKLEKSPDPNDTKTAYIKPQTQQDKINHFDKRHKGWKITDSDKEKIMNRLKK